MFEIQVDELNEEEQEIVDFAFSQVAGQILKKLLVELRGWSVGRKKYPIIQNLEICNQFQGGGDIGLFITLVPKVLQLSFLIR